MKNDRHVLVPDLQVIEDAVENERLVVVLEVRGGCGGAGGEDKFQDLAYGSLVPRAGVGESETVDGDGSEELDDAADGHVLRAE